MKYLMKLYINGKFKESKKHLPKLVNIMTYRSINIKH